VAVVQALAFKGLSYTLLRFLSVERSALSA